MSENDKIGVDRILELLPFGEDKALVILKGHLLIEELITEILKIKLQHNPLAINDRTLERWRFRQKLEIFWALAGSELPVFVWQSIAKLNSIRNKMAHSLEPAEIDIKIAAFTLGINTRIQSQSVYLGDHLALESAVGFLWIELNGCLRRLEAVNGMAAKEEAKT
ncbi:hypothetical protein ACJJIQ_09140 [Microbulbifer sp. ANSA003]|uniref:hypothetical protein n=1 Tax=Microbulbifer sp. ANSA003 TaxID=3243360 RepID=UPI0040418AC4